MPGKKKLKVNGGSIKKFEVKVRTTDITCDNIPIEIVDLRIFTDEDVYRYDIRKDETHPDVCATKKHIEKSLDKAKKELLNVEVSEDAGKSYLFFKVQGIGQTQYTGRRI